VVAGIDSWQAGLALGFLHHLQWGPELVFTFGPYGFVEDILPVSRLTAGLGLAYGMAMVWGLACLAVSALRPSWRLLPASIASWLAISIAANLVEAPELGLAVALGLALSALRGGSLSSPGSGRSPGLPGSDGLPGSGRSPGLPGADGLPGLSGADGLPGSGRSPGLPGAPSVDSVDSADGSPGAPGVDSADGLPGPDPADASQPPRHGIAVFIVLGALAGFQLLVEIDVGLATTGLAILSAAGQHRWLRRRAAIATGSAFAAGLVVPLLAAGQSLGNLASYLRGSLSVMLGYSSAMSLSDGRRAEDWFALVDTALLVTLVVLAFRGSRWLEKAAVFLAITGWTWVALKEGFVRHDLHDLIFFSLVLVALCLVRVPRHWRALQGGCIALAALLACVANAGVPAPVLSPAADAGALAAEIRGLVVPSQWKRAHGLALLQLRSTGDALPAGTVKALAGKTVAVEPFEDAMTLVYHLDWDPEPVLQAYSAYTTYLDDLDARFLESSRAPQRILYQPEALGARDPAWGPPSTMLAMYCHYRPVSVVGKWLLLERATDRCGPARLVGQVTTTFGRTVAVPGLGSSAAGGNPVSGSGSSGSSGSSGRSGRSGSSGRSGRSGSSGRSGRAGGAGRGATAPAAIMVATFSLGSPLSAQLEGVLLKPPAVYADGYSFVTGTAGDDHVLSVPAALGYPPAFSPTPLRALELTGGGWPPGQGTVRIFFYSVSVQIKI